MKKTVAILAFALILLLTACCLAETTYLGTMMVDNCEEWVSLREEPSKSAKRLEKVPLFAIVTDAEWAPEYGEFTWCNYDGQLGYILSEYLVPWADPEPEDDGEAALDVTLNGLHILGEKGYAGGGEYLLITCEDEAGEQRWFYESKTDDVSEMDRIDVFMGGAAQDPMVMVYNSEKGLTALDVVTGEERWTLSDEHLGASISHAVDDQGNIYMGGYDGPDPVAIDVRGNVIWRSSAGESYWLYEIELVDQTLVCHYASLDGEPNAEGLVIFDLDGNLIDKRLVE